jgi:hypothetical protein
MHQIILPFGALGPTRVVCVDGFLGVAYQHPFFPIKDWLRLAKLNLLGQSSGRFYLHAEPPTEVPSRKKFE